jgi:hypothetical protein
MNVLVDALRRAVRAEISAAIDGAGPVSDIRRSTSLAERMEVERSWAYVAQMANILSDERQVP